MSSAKYMQGVQRGGDREEYPKKRPKHHTSLQRPTDMVVPTIRHANVHGQGDEAREPENGCHSIHGQDCELMADVPSLSIVARGEYEEGNGEDGPDGAEDHEVDLAGGKVASCIVVAAVVIGGAIVLACDIGCQAENDDGEDQLDNAHR